jgi:hypothetical protein
MASVKPNYRHCHQLADLDDDLDSYVPPVKHSKYESRPVVSEKTTTTTSSSRVVPVPGTVAGPGTVTGQGISKVDVKVVKKHSYWWIWILAALFLLWLYMSWMNKYKKMGKGNVVIAVASTRPLAVPRSSLGAGPGAGPGLSKVEVTIDNIMVRPSESGPTPTPTPTPPGPKAKVSGAYGASSASSKGWISVHRGSEKVDLLKLSSSSNHLPQVIASANLPYGQYEAIRLHVPRVNVVDEMGSRTTYLANNIIEFAVPFEVKKDADGNKTVVKSKTKGKGLYGGTGTGTGSKDETATTIVLDFSLVDSLYDAIEGIAGTGTGTGKRVKVFAPAISFETQDGAEVSVANKNLTVLKPGRVMAHGMVGTDVSGKTQRGLSIPRDATLVIRDGKITIGSPVPTPSPVPAPVPAPVPGPIPGPTVGPQPSTMRKPMMTPPPVDDEDIYDATEDRTQAQAQETGESGDSGDSGDSSDTMIQPMKAPVSYRRWPAFSGGCYNRA